MNKKELLEAYYKLQDKDRKAVDRLIKQRNKHKGKLMADTKDDFRRLLE